MAPSRTTGQAGLRAARLLLALCGLWAVLAPGQASPGRPSWRYVSSEVVIPRKELGRGKGVRAPGWLSYSLRFGGHRHVIHVRRKRLVWPRHLLLMTQDDQGALQADYPFFPLDCYYLGYLEDVPLSMVTVDTCYGGLQGIMKLDDLAYEVKPLRGSPTFEHVVSQLVADANATGPTYRLGEEQVVDPQLARANVLVGPRLSSKIFASHAARIKGLLLSSRSMYDVKDNVSETAQFLLQLGSLMDTLLQGLDVRYHISSLIIYNRGDPASLKPYHHFSSPFAQYYMSTLKPSLNTHSALILSKDGPHELQYGVRLSGMCGINATLMLGYMNRHVLLLSIIATSQVARSIGVQYDKTVGCVCQRRTTCIMSLYPVLTDAFSNCSFKYMGHIYSTILSSCLYSATDTVYYNKSLTHERCGNSILESPEQCDCGSFKQCYSDPCCLTSCKFTPRSVCDTGLCCTKCKFSPAGTLCRPAVNICDLPEYCRGDTLDCPLNVHMQDGTPCTEEGYCYRGNCTDRTMHCREIFGEHAHDAPDACYAINTRGNRFGHCWRRPKLNKFVACEPSDMKCGRLQCANVTHLPRLQEHVGFHQSLLAGSWCFGVDEHRGTETTDVGHVRNGTPCGLDLFCLGNECSGRITDIGYDCLPTKCGLRGVCNSNRNCHCHVGWDPPQCLKPGAGGSVDSGPPPRMYRSVKQSEMPLVILRIVFARIYILIAALLFGVATNVRTIVTTKVKEVTVDEEKARMDEVTTDAEERSLDEVSVDAEEKSLDEVSVDAQEKALDERTMIKEESKTGEDKLDTPSFETREAQNEGL
ncbi:disintegrin and metalloproteinase domain-containing protein 21-like [Talpa occidentalis]|uniref:disintegrin and metalloproteinase domain-containing protein 21-like n=1 Tax=Talpa occidentalis TaxID=50954 RepID=UPI0023FA13EC|nr:disintegrin and metalloproteinase domain-containing protein 21-like [Talpa occidentalis]